jgi:hypothetical protein
MPPAKLRMSTERIGSSPAEKGFLYITFWAHLRRARSDKDHFEQLRKSLFHDKPLHRSEGELGPLHFTARSEVSELFLNFACPADGSDILS